MLKKKNPKVLVIGTSHKTRGGITSVIKAHKTGFQWEKYRCKWIETHIDTNFVQKIVYFISGIILYAFHLSFYQIVHIHVAAVERKLLFIALALLFKKKIIVHLHIPDPSTTIFSKKKLLYGWCFKKADVVIVLSKQWSDLLKLTYNIDNIQILYNPCPIVNNFGGIKKNHILYAGTLSERKGFKDLIEAFAVIADRFPNWKLIYAGNGDINGGKRLAEKLNIIDQIEFLGWISGKQKEKLFQESSVFCLPSYAEGFPMGVLDAWAYGLPVICTPVGGLPDIVDDGVNCLLFTPGNTTELSNKLKLIISNSSLRKSLELASLNIAQTKFNVNTINTQLAQQYDKLYE
jgi:glycosyltransferase involved in cell wall biosynthesis